MEHLAIQRDPDIGFSSTPAARRSRQAQIWAYDPEMLYSESESAWLNRRAEKIAEERGLPLPIARSQAQAELVRSRAGGHSALVIPFREHPKELPSLP